MSLKIQLPPSLPPNGFDVEIQLRRIPEKSGVVKPRLGTADGRTGDLRPVYIYGRGPGSAATEKTHLIVHVDAADVASFGNRRIDQLLLAAEDLEGKPIDATELNVESVSFRPRR